MLILPQWDGDISLDMDSSYYCPLVILKISDLDFIGFGLQVHVLLRQIIQNESSLHVDFS